MLWIRFPSGRFEQMILFLDLKIAYVRQRCAEAEDSGVQRRYV